MVQRQIAGIVGCDYTESELRVGTQSDWVGKCGRVRPVLGEGEWAQREKVEGEGGGQGGCKDECQGEWEGIARDPERWTGGKQEEVPVPQFEHLTQTTANVVPPTLDSNEAAQATVHHQGSSLLPALQVPSSPPPLHRRPSQLQAYRAHKVDGCIVHPGDRLIRFLVPVPHIQLTVVLTRCSVSSPNSNTVIVIAHRSPANQTGCHFARKHASQHSRIPVVQEYSPFEKFTFRTPIKTNSIKSIDSSSFVHTRTHHIICPSLASEQRLSDRIEWSRVDAIALTNGFPSHSTNAKSYNTSLSAHRSDGRLVRSQRTQGGASTAEMQSGPSSNAQPAASSAGQSQRLPASSGAQLNSLHQNVLILTPRIEQTLSTVRDVKDVAPNITNMLDDVSRIGQDTGNADVRLGQIEEWIDDLTDEVAHADNSVMQLTAEVDTIREEQYSRLQAALAHRIYKNKRFAAMDRDLHDILCSRGIAPPIEDDERWNGDLSENTEEWNTA
ncbi:hypothetical protein V8D89_016352 [Ganoderma adspersum]